MPPALTIEHQHFETIHFFLLIGLFRPPRSGSRSAFPLRRIRSSQPKSMRIRIQIHNICLINPARWWNLLQGGGKKSLYKYGRMGCDCGIGNAPDAITTPKNLLRQHSNDKTGGKHQLFFSVGTISIKRKSGDSATRYSQIKVTPVANLSPVSLIPLVAPWLANISANFRMNSIWLFWGLGEGGSWKKNSWHCPFQGPFCPFSKQGISWISP